MRIAFDWSTGVRTARLDDGCRCVHHPVEGEPVGYAAWHEWAPKYGKTHRQTRCATPGCPILCWPDSRVAVLTPETP